jgi:hypothetical protein
MAKKKSELAAALFAITSFILFFVFIGIGKDVGFFFWLVLIAVFYKIHQKIKVKEKEKEIVSKPRAETKYVEERSQTEYPVSVVVKTEAPEQPVADIKILLTGHGIRETKSTDGFGSTRFIVPVGEYTISPEHVRGYERPKPEHITVETERIVKLIMKRKVCEVIVRITDEKIGGSIPGVLVTIGETQSKTGDDGKTYFSDVPVGEQKLIADFKSELYETGTQTFVFKEDAVNRIEIALKPKSLLSPQQKTELEHIRKAFHVAFENVPAYCDKGIPKYMHEISTVVLAIIERVASCPSFFLNSSVPPSEALNQMIDVATTVCRKITEVMLSEKNIDLYAAIEKSSNFASSSPQFTFDLDESISIYDNKIGHLISDPEGFSSAGFGETQKKLTIVDGEITAKVQEFTTVPAASIWRISKQLLIYADAEIASGLKKGIMIFMADLLLDYTKRMFEVPEMVGRLKLKPS